MTDRPNPLDPPKGDAASFGTFETIRLDYPEMHVLRVTLDRPQVLNAMNTVMMEELRDVFQRLYYGFEAARCVILTGAGDRAFCAGADLKERDGMTTEVWMRQHAVLEQTARAMFDCPIPVIAAMNGGAYGGGFELALACDFIYAADHAKMALPEVTRGLIPGAGGTQNLPRAAGLRRAKEMIFTGEAVTAMAAADYGIVNRVSTPDRLMEDVLETARKIAANGPIAVRQAKRSADKAGDLDRNAGYGFEVEAYNRAVMSEDRYEGVRAFNEKRKPDFKGK